MKMKNEIKHRSKLLSLILRHKPELAGITLGEGGWVSVAKLLSGIANMGKAMTKDQLIEVVETNDKKRFTLSEDRLSIRAAQGHTVNVALGLLPVTPPKQLYHGTATRFLDAIQSEGLKSMKRDHVHLSADIETASRVGKRHGKLVILQIDAGKLHASGQEFYQADNGVWLTGPIAPKWFEVIKEA